LFNEDFLPADSHQLRTYQLASNEQKTLKHITEPKHHLLQQYWVSRYLDTMYNTE